MAVLKELILTVSTLGGCGSLERTDFNSFYFGKVWQSSKNGFLQFLLLGRCGSLERKRFNNFDFGKV